MHTHSLPLMTRVTPHLVGSDTPGWGCWDMGSDDVGRVTSMVIPAPGAHRVIWVIHPLVTQVWCARETREEPHAPALVPGGLLSMG
jgi:hypothetical protein